MLHEETTRRVQELFHEKVCCRCRQPAQRIPGPVTVEEMKYTLDRSAIASRLVPVDPQQSSVQLLDQRGDAEPNMASWQ
jgi:hypothetical protein